MGDWKALAEPFRGAFSEQEGRPTDPVVYLKIFVVGFLENIVYDTDLAERCADSIAIREFLGYGLTEKPPDHSSISRNRGLIGECCDIGEVLGRTVGLCEAQGLVSGAEAGVDASLVGANASFSSLRSITTGKGVREHLREVAEKNPDSGPRAKRPVSNGEFRSGSDPDARLAKPRGKPSGMYYKATHVTDAKGGIILGADCHRADVGDAEAGRPVVEEAQANLEATGRRLGTVVGDAGYDDRKFHAHLEGLGTEPLTNYQSDGRKPKGFRKADFSYDDQRDCYVCPVGCRAHRVGDSSGVRQYRTRAQDCRACEHRSQCIGKGKVRTVKRLEHEASRERNLARCHTERGRQLLRRRKEIVEHPFGYMKSYGGLKFINTRSLAKGRMKVIMAAVAWDLKKLVRALDKRASAQLAACAPQPLRPDCSQQATVALRSPRAAVISSLLPGGFHTALQLIGSALRRNRLTLLAHPACA